jgi:AcrR family transcriptional regulator
MNEGPGEAETGPIASRAQLVEHARVLFAARGYAATSIGAIQAAAGVSRGGLYHHFPNKRALFEAVYDQLEDEIGRAIGKAAAKAGPDDALRAGCLAWLDLATDPEVRQVTLIDAPAVIGWEAWSATEDRRGLGLLRAALVREADRGRLDRALVDPVARILLAALIELGLTIARSDRPRAAHRTARAGLDHLLAGLLVPA